MVNANKAQSLMLREAYAIETKYVQDQIFRPVTSAKLTRQVIEKESRFDPAEMDDCRRLR